MADLTHPKKQAASKNIGSEQATSISWAQSALIGMQSISLLQTSARGSTYDLNIEREYLMEYCQTQPYTRRETCLFPNDRRCPKVRIQHHSSANCIT
jgi:hypothetical protein